MDGRSEGITRKSVDMTTAQADTIEQMIAVMQQRASEAAGMTVKITTRQFFHALLKEKAQALGLEWPEDYPATGGDRRVES